MQAAIPPYEAVNTFYDPTTYQAAVMVIQHKETSAVQRLQFVMLLSLAAGIQNMAEPEPTIEIPHPGMKGN